MIILHVTELQTIMCLSSSFSSSYSLQLNPGARSQEIDVPASSSSNQMCDSSSFKLPVLNGLVVSNSVSSLSQFTFFSNTPFSPIIVFSPLSSSSLSLLSHFLTYYTLRASQLPWGLSLLPSSISYEWKTLQDVVYLAPIQIFIVPV